MTTVSKILSKILSQLKKRPPKAALPITNVANRVADHVRALVPEAFQLPDVWVTGSNVWQFLYDMEPQESSDIDIIVADEGVRSQLVLLLDARCVADTAPSTRDRVDLGGKKYACADGRSIDIWRYDNDIVTTLRGYPRHSHAHCMAAFCPSTGVLLVIPNPEAP